MPGKRGNERPVPATSEMMEELSGYRRERELPTLPSQDEDTPSGVSRREATGFADWF